jgi:hypothetical protein
VSLSVSHLRTSHATSENCLFTHVGYQLHTVSNAKLGNFVGIHSNISGQFMWGFLGNGNFIFMIEWMEFSKMRDLYCCC